MSSDLKNLPLSALTGSEKLPLSALTDYGSRCEALRERRAAILEASREQSLSQLAASFGELRLLFEEMWKANPCEYFQKALLSSRQNFDTFVAGVKSRPTVHVEVARSDLKGLDTVGYKALMSASFAAIS